MSTEDGRPWVTVELDGLVAHFPLSDGGVFTVPLTPDGAYALIGELVERVDALKKSPELQKKLASKAVDIAIDWWTKRKSRR